MKKYKNLLISFFIPIIIYGLVCIFNHIYPFGDKILPMLDGYNQYPGFLNSFKEFIFNHQTILYSFKGLTGFNLYAASIYYTFNITNILFLLFKTNHIINFYTLMIPFKMGLASLTMNIFLNYLKKDNKNYIYSICYGLSAYNLLYYLNYMWFDSIILLPLVILGIEKLFNENKGYLYSIFLTLSIIFNFYIGYMICIFSLLYFIYKWILNNFKKEYLFKFIFYSLISGLISSFILIPVILELMQGKGLLFEGTNYLKFDLDFINVFYKLTLGSFLNGDLEYGTPNIYISLFVYLNAFLFFLNKNIKLKERIISLCIIIFFLLSMSFNLLDYFWQMLQMPIYYPVRYAFIFDFYLIYLCFKNYTNNDLSLKKTFITLIIIVILCLIGFFTSGNLLDKINIPAKAIYLTISILFLTYYTFIMNSKDFKKYIWIVIIVELFANTFVTFKNNGNTITIEEFNYKYQNNNYVINKLELDYFDRATFKDRNIKNNGLLHNYNDLNFFSSVRNKKTLTLLEKIMDVNIFDECNADYYYSNPITNSILNIKYYISDEEIDYYDLIDTYHNNYIHKNKDTPGIGFITKDLSNLKITDNYLNNINTLVKTINNNDKDIMTEAKVTDKNVSCTKDICITYGKESYIKYELTASKDILLVIKNDYPGPSPKTKYYIKLNNKETKTNKYPFYLKKNDKVSITINPDEQFKDYFFHVYEIDYKVYQEFISNIKSNPLRITDYQNDAHFKGQVNLTEDGFLYTSISNDKGWKVKVDGKDYKITPIYDGFIGLNLTKGKHTIEFNYYPPGLKIGLFITIPSLLTLVIIIIIQKKKTN